MNNIPVSIYYIINNNTGRYSMFLIQSLCIHSLTQVQLRTLSLPMSSGASVECLRTPNYTRRTTHLDVNKANTHLDVTYLVSYLWSSGQIGTTHLDVTKVKYTARSDQSCIPHRSSTHTRRWQHTSSAISTLTLFHTGTNTMGSPGCSESHTRRWRYTSNGTQALTLSHTGTNTMASPGSSVVLTGRPTSGV